MTEMVERPTALREEIGDAADSRNMSFGRFIAIVIGLQLLGAILGSLLVQVVNR